MEKIVIIGAGAIGCEMRGLLKNKNLAVEVWDKDVSKMPRRRTLQEALPGARFVFLCIPARAVREAALMIAPVLPRKAAVISLAKGIEPFSKETMDRALPRYLPKGQPVVILGGPMLAADLRNGLPGMGIAASRSSAARTSVARLFRGTALFLEPSPDVRSVALLGTIKNIYTIALGAVDGLGWGSNAKGKLLVLAMQEMEKLLVLLGGSRNAARGLAGLGDLAATGFSPTSRNYQFGYALARGRISSALCEGPASLGLIQKQLGKRVKQFPILGVLQKSIQHPKDLSAQFKRLIDK